MPDREFRDEIRPLGEALFPRAVMQLERATGAAINADGTIRTDAIAASLPWQRIDFYFPGEVTAGNAYGGIYEIPQGGRIQRVTARIRNAPTSGPFTFRLMVNGADAGFAASVQPGTTSETNGAAIDVPAGAVVTVGIINTGDAMDATISVFYSQTPGGS